MAEFTGKTKEEAIEIGLKEMNLEEEKADIEVVEEKDGFLGIGKKVVVKITEKEKMENTDMTDGERAVEFLNKVFEYMGLVAKAELVKDEDNIEIVLEAEKSSNVIGYRGEVLDSLQCLAGSIANKGEEDYKRVVVNCEGYREKREETLISLAHKLSNKAVKTGRKVSLEPMNPYERRIIHSTLADSEDVKTLSEGKEPNRYVTIIPNNLRSFGRYYDNDKRDYNGGKKPYNKGKGEKFNNNNRNNFRSGKPSQSRPKTSGFGRFIGNSLKDGK